MPDGGSGVDAEAGARPEERALVTFEPVGVGPAEIASVPADGVLAALVFLLSLATGVRLARRRELRARWVVQAHVVAVFAGLAGSKVPAAAAAWPELREDPAALLALLVAEGSAAWATAAVLAVLLGMALASGRPARFLDVVAPGGLLVGATYLGLRLVDASAPLAAAATVVVVVAAAAGARALAVRSRTDGWAALLAAEGGALGVALALVTLRGPADPLAMAASAAPALLLALHLARLVAARRRAEG